MKDTEKLFAAIDSLEEEYIGYWEGFCNIESPTENKAAVDAAVDYIEALAAARGWKIERGHQDAAGDVLCVTLNPDAPGRPIAFSGHADTVHPIGLFGQPPVRIDRENDRIYGPGVMDCKGGVIAGLMAMDALQRVGFTERPVMMLVQSDEEVSSRYSNKGTIRWICEKARDVEAFMNCEGYSVGKYVLIRKGISRYRFTVTGRAIHASGCYKGVSAIREAAYKIIELEQYKDPKGLTCSCGLISGGTAENSVPETCTFTADIRFADREQMEEGDRIVNEVAARSFVEGSSCVVTLASRRVAMEYQQRNYDLLDKLNAVFASCGLSEVAAGSSKGGSDAADVSVFGIPCVDSVGTAGGRIHTKEEYSRISSLRESACRLAAAAYLL